jgi:O-antigen/teichoic acid export membrane protein
MGEPENATAKAMPDTIPAANQAPLDGLSVPVETPPPAPVPAAVPNIRKAAMRAAMWMAVGYGALKILSFATGMIQTYWVKPEVLGLIGTAGVFIMGLHMFSDVGIGLSVVQNKRGDEPDFLHTAWTLQVIRGIVLWIATWVIAWPVAALWDEPILMILLPVMGTVAAIDGLNSTSLFTLNRALSRGPIVALQVTVQTTGMLVTLAWIILVSPDVWAFVIGQLATSLLNMTLTHVALSGYGSRFRWEAAAARELLHFGKWIFLSTLITFFAFQAEPLIVSKVAGPSLFGVFTRAMTLGAIATELMSMFANELVFPVYSRMQREGRDIRTNFKKVHFSAASFAGFLVCGLLASGSSLCRLYGDAYHGAAWMLPFVAVGAWFKMLEATTGASLMTLGQTRSVMLSNASRLVGVMIFVPLGFWLGRQAGLASELDPLGGGFVGMLLGFVVADFVRYLIVVWMARLNGMSAVKYDIALAFVVVVVSVLAAQAGQYLGEILGTQVVSPNKDIRVSVASTVGLYASPHGPGPLMGTSTLLLAKTPKIQTLMVFLCQGALVVVIWGILYLVGFRRVLRSRPRPA